MDWWLVVTHNLYVVVLGLIYLFLKLGAKHVVHALTGVPSDGWDTASWLGVDLSVLSLVTSLAAGITARMGFDSQESTVFFTLLVVLVLGSISCYGFFIKRRSSDELNRCPPYRDIRLAVPLTLGWLFGFLGFIPTLECLLGSGLGVPK